MRSRVMQLFFIVLLGIILMHGFKRTVDISNSSESRQPRYTAEMNRVIKEKKEIDYKAVAEALNLEDSPFLDNDN